MTVYYVDDGGDGTTESSWATADTSINALDTEYALASGDIVYFGHDMQCQATNTGSLFITGPTSGAPTLLISATQGSSPPTYAKSSTNQIDTTENTTYSIIFDGSFALYGLCLNTGLAFSFLNDQDETFYAYEVTFKLAANGYLSIGGYSQTFDSVTVDLSNDGTTERTLPVLRFGGNARSVEFRNLSFVGGGYRTGTIFDYNGAVNLAISSSDFSVFTNATACEFFPGAGLWRGYISNCLTAATWTPFSSGTPYEGLDLMFTNVGPADAPTYLYHKTTRGETLSSSAIYRTGGATVEADPCAWLITTSAACSEGSPHNIPWIYGTVGATGSKTFDVYITNDTADFTDADVWLEVEYLATADEAQTVLASDHRATITTTAAAQTDDTTSSWNGTGPSFTYKQKLSVTATVNETGMYRARVCVGLASIASSRYFYIDPKVTVS